MNRHDRRLAAKQTTIGAPKAAPDAAAEAALLRRAIELFGVGDFAGAQPLLQELLAHDPRHPEALNGLGLIADRTGDSKAAAKLFRQAIAVTPHAAEFHNNLGLALLNLGDRAAALAAFERTVALKPDHLAAINNIGRVHEMEGRLDQAVATLKRVLALDPNFQAARESLSNLYKASVPGWHFAMMNDEPRNRAYDEALRRLAPGRGVLDIGTGAGLLAMMAARAGAKWVTSCEINPPLAAMAREVVAANGLSERINLVVKPSSALKVGTDLPQRADLLVCEIFGSSLLNEFVLPTIEHAHASLLAPGAIVVPHAASLRAYLVGGPAIEGNFFVTEAAGFTLAPFNEFSQHKLGLRLDRLPYDVLSDEFEIFRFDFTQSNFAPESRAIDVVATRPGRCVAVAQWIRLDLAEGCVYENRPSAGTLLDGWTHIIYRLPAPVELQAGSRLRLVAQHNRTTVLVSQDGGIG